MNSQSDCTALRQSDWATDYYYRCFAAMDAVAGLSIDAVRQICMANHAVGAPPCSVKCETCPSVTFMQEALLRFSR
jgi:hypothetical protein